MATLLLGVLDFENIRIDDVSDVVGIESGFVVIDDFLVKVADLAQILQRQDGDVKNRAIYHVTSTVTWRILL